MQLVGFSDEVLDTTFVGKNESHLAVATNSNDIKVYNLSNMNSQILKGHSDFVMALSNCKTMPEIFASASKVIIYYYYNFSTIILLHDD